VLDVAILADLTVAVVVVTAVTPAALAEVPEVEVTTTE
jgi:hypothetical protein